MLFLIFIPLTVLSLQVFLIPHSHDDVGWINTFEEYYYGTNEYIHKGNVKFTYDTVLRELMLDQEKTFIIVEIAYFAKWYEEQRQNIQAIVKQLVQNRQFEFVNGGWVMNDEACTYFEDIVEQYTLGHQWIYKNFKIKPRVALAIDQFGHSKQQAAIYLQLGLDYLVLNRIHFLDHKRRKNNRNLEFFWDLSDFLPNSNRTTLLTHLLYKHYSVPLQFTYDEITSQSILVKSNISEFPNTISPNLEMKSKELSTFFQNESQSYQNSPILHMWGDDFYYSNARKDYYSIDSFIKSVKDIEIRYGTFQEYFKILENNTKEFETFKSDFFPYSDEEDCYWTGYFTSRPHLKKEIHKAGRYLMNVRTFLLMRQIQKKEQNYEEFLPLRQALSITQHHDAITGTCRKKVVTDYLNKINYGKEQLNQLFQKEIKKIVFNEMNISMKEIQQKYNNSEKKTLIIVYNPSHTLEKTMKIKCSKCIVKKLIEPNVALDIENERICFDEWEKDCWIFFKDTLYERNFSYYISLKGIPSTIEPLKEEVNEIKLDEFNINYFYYTPQGSGAYIFKSHNQPKSYTSFDSRLQFNGKLVQLSYYNNSQMEVKLIKIDDHWKLTTYLNPLRQDNKGKEIVLRIRTNQSTTNFFTDSNGLHFMERNSTQKNQYAYTNYYPITSGIEIQNVVCVIPDRPQGGTVYADGTIEIMLNRRSYMDDSRGLGEILNEEGLKVITNHLFAFDKSQKRLLQKERDQSIITHYTTLEEDYEFKTLDEKMKLDQVDEKTYLKEDLISLDNKRIMIRITNLNEKENIKYKTQFQRVTLNGLHEIEEQFLELAPLEMRTYLLPLQ